MAGTWNGTNYYGDDTNETVRGTVANEIMLGYGGDDNLFGEGGDDVIDGGVGSDALDGGIGNDTLTDVGSIPGGFTGIIGRDTLRGGVGDDILRFYSPDTGDFAYGDAGTDTIHLDFRNATDTQRVTFRVAPNTVVKLNDANTVGVSSIERVNFLGGKGDDFVIGGELNDTLVGGLGSYGFGPDGNDVLRGMGGDDSIDGGTGIQQIDGGADTDVASFDLSAAGVAFRILSGAVINLGAWGSVRNVENLSQVKTSTGNDVFDINQASRIQITSGDGADRITVGNAGGSIYAGQGNDFVRMGAGSDYVNPGYGADTVYLGAGNDSSDNYEGGSSRSSTEPDRIYGEAGDDRIYTSAGADNLDGGADNDTLYGGGGADTVLGGDGNDRIEGEGGADRIDGGAGNDVINADYDYWTSTTTADADTLNGGEGNDTITGGIGLDVINGGLGDDRLTAYAFSGGALDTQVDQLSGGAGIDTLGFEGFSYLSTAALTISLGPTTGIFLDGQLTAQATTVDRLDVSAYGTGDHQITGGRFADVVRPGEGDDTINTLGGDDTISAYDYGGTDSNTILTGSGNDMASMYLGGNDDVDLEAGNDALTLSNVNSNPAGLSSYEGGVGTDTLTVYTRFGFAGVSFDGATLRSGASVIGAATGFEKVVYYGSSDVFDFNGLVGDDRVELGAADDAAFGSGGNDTLLGGAGADTLGGGAGNDALTGGLGADAFRFDAALAAGNVDVVIDFSVADDTIELENAIFTAFASPGRLAAGALRIGSAAADGNDRIIYNPADGALSYDADGNTAGGVAAVRIATLSTNLPITSADFIVV